MGMCLRSMIQNKVKDWLPGGTGTSKHKAAVALPVKLRCVRRTLFATRLSDDARLLASAGGRARRRAVSHLLCCRMPASACGRTADRSQSWVLAVLLALAGLPVQGQAQSLGLTLEREFGNAARGDESQRPVFASGEQISTSAAGVTVIRGRHAFDAAAR